MTSTLLLALLFLTPPAIGVNLKTDGPCPACWGTTFDLESQRELLLDVAKKSILDKLHLRQRPTLSQPVSRGALKTALQRLRGSRPETLSDHDQRQEEYEIISFADTGLSSSNQTRLEFHFSGRMAAGVKVQQTRFMFFVQFPLNTTRTMNIRVLVLRPYDANLTLTSQHVLQVDASGWHQLLLGPEAQAAYSQGHLTLELVPESQVAHSSLILGGLSHRPFVAAQVRVEGKHRVHRRGIDCQGVSRMCCRQEFFVDFREIGWNDWIIQPEGYAMNFCTGQCPLHVAGMPGISASFHTAVLNLLKANAATGTAAGGGSCCVPTSRRPLSLLYYDRDSNIVKTDIPDMVVEACGCS